MRNAQVAASKPDVRDGESPSAALREEVARLKVELARAASKIAELEARADIDPLLDIPNRRSFDRELARSLSYVKRYGTGAALVFIDLDEFKLINDRHGHPAGDALLKAVVAGLKRYVRASDVVARLGGDEFAVLLWNLDATRACAKARELEAVIAGTEVTYAAVRLSVGASAGSVALAAEATPAAILEAADRAMYARKRERRG